MYTIGFEKDSVGELLEQGMIDLALGVFPNPPRQTRLEPIFEEHFVGIARRGHPDVKICMLWSVLSDRDEANQWLRNTIKSLASQL